MYDTFREESKLNIEKKERKRKRRNKLKNFKKKTNIFLVIVLFEYDLQTSADIE